MASFAATSPCTGVKQCQSHRRQTTRNHEKTPFVRHHLGVSSLRSLDDTRLLCGPNLLNSVVYTSVGVTGGRSVCSLSHSLLLLLLWLFFCFLRR